MGAQAEVADRGIPDADHAPVAGVADIDDADVALDLAAAAVDRRPIGMVDQDFAVADDLLDHRDMGHRHAARAREGHDRALAGLSRKSTRLKYSPSCAPRKRFSAGK